MARLSLLIALVVLVAVSDAAFRVKRSPQFSGAEAHAGARGFGRPGFGGSERFDGPGAGGPGRFDRPGFGGPGRFDRPGFGGRGFGQPGGIGGGLGHGGYPRQGGSINIAKSVSINSGRGGGGRSSANAGSFGGK